MNKKGFTLLEIILSLAIFAIMSVGFLSVFSTIFINTYRTSIITEETFEAQKLLEEQILDVKEKILNNDHSSITVAEDTHVLFSSYGADFEREVIVYPLTALLSNGATLETLVSQVRPPQLIVPVIESPVIITANTTLEVPYPNIGMNQLLSVNGHTPTSISNEGYLIHMGRRARDARSALLRDRRGARRPGGRRPQAPAHHGSRQPRNRSARWPGRRRPAQQIGRASCRERVLI